MKQLALFTLLLLSGCLSPIQTPPIEPDDRIVEPAEMPSITVTASQDAYDSIRGWLGDANTVTLHDAASIVRDDVTVRIPAGATCAYSFTDDAGTFQFAKPLPNVVASVIGFKVSPTLSQIVLRVDGSGTAKTGIGSYKFKWLADEESGVAQADSRPEVWAYSMENCGPCVTAKGDLAEAKDLPFRIVWRDEAAPAWLTTRPAFWWHVRGDRPSQADVANTRQVQGWMGLKDFTSRWAKSREVSPKASAAAARPFDQRTSGSRSAALNLSGHWSGPFSTRGELIDHLNHGIHSHKKRELDTMTNEQLLHLHDYEHARENGSKRGLFPSIGAALFGR